MKLSHWQGCSARKENKMELQKDKKPKKEIEILVNGQIHTVEKDTLTYEEVVIMAFGNYEDKPDINYSVTYFHGNVHKPKGELVKGESVKAKKGMIFNVSRTDRS